MSLDRRYRLVKNCMFGDKGDIIIVYKSPFLRAYAVSRTGSFRTINPELYTEIKNIYPNNKLFRRLYPNGKEVNGFWEVEVE